MAAVTQVADRLVTRTGSFTQPSISTPDPAWSATQQFLSTAVMAASSPEIVQTHVSPDRQFRAEVVRYDCVPVSGPDEVAYEQLKIVRLSDGTEAIISDQLKYCGGLGAAGLGGLFWSPDGRYFYFTISSEGVPDGCCCDLWDTNSDSWQYDLVTGKLTPDN